MKALMVCASTESVNIRVNADILTGRAWASRELRRKDYTDLWKLYWVCVREANQIVTRQNERERMYAGYGATESDERLKTVSQHQPLLYMETISSVSVTCKQSLSSLPM